MSSEEIVDIFHGLGKQAEICPSTKTRKVAGGVGNDGKHRGVVVFLDRVIRTHTGRNARAAALAARDPAFLLAITTGTATSKKE